MSQTINLFDSLVGIVIGVRFRANFSIEDILGKIVDTILYSKNAYFDSNKFPHVKGRVTDRVLENPTTGDYLLLNNSNLILDVFFTDIFKKSDYDFIIEKFDEEIMKGVIQKHKIVDLMRIGLVRKYIIKDEDLAKNFIDVTLNKSLKDVNDINLTFSKRIPRMSALSNVEVNDYDNVIFNVIKYASESELYISVDYQRYFKPFVQSIDEVKYTNFIKDAFHYNEKNYFEWIKNNYLLEANEQKQLQ